MKRIRSSRKAVGSMIIGLMIILPFQNCGKGFEKLDGVDELASMSAASQPYP